MTSVAHVSVDQPFDIHEDARTEETEVMPDDIETESATMGRVQTEEEVHDEFDHGDHAEDHHLDVDEEEDDDVAEEEDGRDDGSSDDEIIDRSVQADLNKLQRDFPGFRDKYRLIKRIGEGGLHLFASDIAVFFLDANEPAWLQVHFPPSTKQKISVTASTTTAGI